MEESTIKKEASRNLERKHVKTTREENIFSRTQRLFRETILNSDDTTCNVKLIQAHRRRFSEGSTRSFSEGNVTLSSTHLMYNMRTVDLCFSKNNVGLPYHPKGLLSYSTAAQTKPSCLLACSLQSGLLLSPTLLLLFPSIFVYGW